jgi:hypothetical protein
VGGKAKASKTLLSSQGTIVGRKGKGEVLQDLTKSGAKGVSGGRPFLVALAFYAEQSCPL